MEHGEKIMECDINLDVVNSKESGKYRWGMSDRC